MNLEALIMLILVFVSPPSEILRSRFSLKRTTPAGDNKKGKPAEISAFVALLFFIQWARTECS